MSSNDDNYVNLNTELSGNQFSEMISINIICRLCANQSDKLIGIYSEDGIKNDLAEKLNLYLPIKVNQMDHLPLQCCWQCASTLLAWHDLVVTSVEADRRLRSCQFVTEKQLEELTSSYEAGKSNLSSINEEESIMATESLSKNNVDYETLNTAELLIEETPSQAEEKLKMHYESEADLLYTGSSEADYSLVKEEKYEKNGTHSCLSPKQAKADSSDQNTDGGIIYKFECVYCPTLFIAQSDVYDHLKEEHPDEDYNEIKINDESLKTEAEENSDKKNFARRNFHAKHMTKYPLPKINPEEINEAKVEIEGRIFYMCKQCGKSLHSMYTYMWHIRIHTGERPYVCNLCNKQFRVSQGLVRHLKETHERIKNFDCDICGRFFATKRNVEEHRRIHTNERPYVCAICGKSFKQKASLFVHNRSHSTEFPFACTECPQKFRTKPPLLVHLTKHTGEKPFPCDVCGRHFRIKYELKRHKLIHSEEKPFVCRMCSQSFRQKRYLRNHLKLNHNVSNLNQLLEEYINVT